MFGVVWRFGVCGSCFLLIGQRIGKSETNVRGIAGLPEVNPEYNGMDDVNVTRTNVHYRGRFLFPVCKLRRNIVEHGHYSTCSVSGGRRMMHLDRERGNTHMAMEYGVFVPQGWRMDLTDIQDPVEQFEAMTSVAKEADKGPWDSIWVYDHFHVIRSA
jgi:hypothetical protein